jgi:hypothetical protein
MSANPPSTHSNLIVENPPEPALPSEHTMQVPNPSLTIQTGSSESNPISSDSGSPFSPRSGTSSGKASSNLRSNAKPHEILERQPVEPRILKVSSADIAALRQVITEFKEQFIEY